MLSVGIDHFVPAWYEVKRVTRNSVLNSFRILTLNSGNQDCTGQMAAAIYEIKQNLVKLEADPVLGKGLNDANVSRKGNKVDNDLFDR